MFFAAIATILGTIYFVLGDNRLLIAAVASFALSTLILTTLRHRKKELMLFITSFLLVFFNYNLRAESLEYTEYKNLDLSQYQIKIIQHPKERFFKDEFVVELTSPKTNFIEKLFLTKRFLVKASSHQALIKNDIIKIEDYQIEKLKYPQNKIYKKDKVFYEIKSKKIRYLKHQENIFNKLQNNIKAYYQASLNKENAQIASSIILGSRSSKLDQGFISTIRKLGLGHFFAASGFHLLILTLISNWLFNLLKLNFRISSLLNLSLVFGYMAITDFSPSIVRAGIFISAYLILNLLERKPVGIRLLVYLAAIMLVIDPYSIFDLGFQLSYLATLAILIWTRPIQEKLKTLALPQYFKEIISVSLSVQILLLPVVIYYFDSLQIWSLIANIIFTPVLSLLTLLSFLGLSFIIEPFLNLFRQVIVAAANLPGLNLSADLDTSSLFYMLAIFNLLAYILLIEKEPLKESFAELFDQKNKLEQSLIKSCQKLLNNKFTQASIGFFLVLVFFTTNLPARGVTNLLVENGSIKANKELNEFYQNKTQNHLYFNLGDLKALVIKDRSFKKIVLLKDDLRPVNLLILKNLNNNDIYLKTLIEKLEPQIVVCSFTKETSKVRKNIEFISANANTLVNSGEIKISDGKYWWLKSV